MKSLAAVLLLVGALFLPGCTYVPAVEPTDLSAPNPAECEIEAAQAEN